MKRGQVLSAGRAPKRALHHVLSTIGQFRCVFANTVAPGSPPELSSLISNVVSICFPHFKMLLHSSLNHFCWWLLCTFSETNSSRDQSLFMMSQTQGIQPFGASHVVFTSQCSFTVLEITFANGKNTFDLIFGFFLVFFGGGGTFQQWLISTDNHKNTTSFSASPVFYTSHSSSTHGSTFSLMTQRCSWWFLCIFLENAFQRWPVSIYNHWSHDH